MYELITYSKKNLLLEKKVALPGNPGSAPPPSPIYTIGDKSVTTRIKDRIRVYHNKPHEKSYHLYQNGRSHKPISIVNYQMEVHSPSLHFDTSKQTKSLMPLARGSHSFNFQFISKYTEQLLPPGEQ
jgi:hypothetical protein